LVNPKDIDTLSSELENRLDDLFAENDVLPTDDQDKNLKEHYPLAELKNLILSIDWEITDEVLESFLQQLKDLRLTYQHDKIISTFLQILNSLGKYIKTNRAKAHPKTFKILNSVFSSLDSIVLSGDMSETAKKKILRAEMNRYQELRAQIVKSKAGSSGQPKKKARPAVSAEPKVAKKKEASVIGEVEPSDKPAVDLREELILTEEQPQADAAVETLAQAVDEIKRYIHAEINALSEEIQNLRERK
jgi:flagellar biosynthesis regulator FlbT